MFRGIAILIILVSTAVFLAAESPQAILFENCSKCHSPAKRKGGLLIDSRESLIKGGDSGAAIEPGKSGESYLIETLFPDAESHMPPKGQLKPREIETLEKWINQGAKWDPKHWAALTKPKRMEVTLTSLPGSFAPVLAMALSPDGKHLAVGRGGDVDWYEVAFPDDAKKPPMINFVKKLQSHGDLVQSIAFSADGSQIVSGGFRKLIWRDLKSGNGTEISTPFIGRLTSLAFSPDGKTLLVADSLPSQTAMLHVFDVPSKKHRKTIEGAHDDSIFDLAFSRDGKQLASASADKLVLLRDTAEFEVATTLEGHTSYVLGLAFGPKGKRIATSGDDEVIKVWNTGSGEQILSFSTKNSGPVGGVAWTVDPDQQRKKTAEKDKKKAAEVNTDRIVAINDLGQPGTFTELNEHEGAQRSTGAKERRHDGVSVALTALAYDESWLILYAGSEDGRIFAWNKLGKKFQELGDSP
jgi:WD40 repeat protein